MTVTVKPPPVLENVTFVITGLLFGMAIVVGAGAGSVAPAAVNAVLMVALRSPREELHHLILAPH